MVRLYLFQSFADIGQRRLSMTYVSVLKIPDRIRCRIELLTRPMRPWDCSSRGRKRDPSSLAVSISSRSGSTTFRHARERRCQVRRLSGQRADVVKHRMDPDLRDPAEKPLGHDLRDIFISDLRSGSGIIPVRQSKESRSGREITDKMSKRIFWKCSPMSTLRRNSVV